MTSPLILGAGRSGIAAAQLARAHGAIPTVIDLYPTDTARTTLEAAGISCLKIEPNAFPEGSFDGVITSPSIPLESHWIRHAQAQGLPILSELDFGARHWQGDAIAVTGSKGKSSVIKCLTDILNQAGRPAVTAGNYGIPLSQRVLEYPHAGKGIIAVTEVSSFQMEHTTFFAPSLAAILNIQADHLDRHHTIETYRALKFKLFQNIIDPSCAFITPGITQEATSQPVYSCTTGPLPHVDDIPTGYFANPILAPAAAIICAMLTRLGIPQDIIIHGLRTFEPLPHRMQRIATINGITYIDDSKATTLAATHAALHMLTPPIRLIAGGLLKESDLTFLRPTLQSTVAKAYIIGSETRPFLEAWRDAVPLEDCGTMANAMHAIHRDASPGDTVLLSPGTASFDQYPGMAARGNDFQSLIPQIGEV